MLHDSVHRERNLPEGFKIDVFEIMAELCLVCNVMFVYTDGQTNCSCHSMFQISKLCQVMTQWILYAEIVCNECVCACVHIYIYIYMCVCVCVRV